MFTLQRTELQVRRSRWIAKLVDKGVSPSDASQILAIADSDSLFAYDWTHSSWRKMCNVFHQDTTRLGAFDSYQRHIHAITLVHRTCKEIVDHPGSKATHLLDPQFATDWLTRETLHMGLYNLHLPDSTNALRSLRVLRAALLILPIFM